MSWFDEVKADFIKCFIREERYRLIWEGIGVTIKISLLAALLGLIIGFIIAEFNLSKIMLLNILGKVYTAIIRGTPSVTQLMIVYFVIFGVALSDYEVQKWIIAAIAFGINSGAYVSEIIRAGILSIDKGQTEAGRSLGLSKTHTMMLIVVPQALKNIFPALCNEFITLIKETAIVGYIGLMDIQKAGDFIKTKTYQTFMPLIGTAVIYFVIIKILTVLLRLYENHIRKSEQR